MADGHGGHRTPRNPAPVSGPGRLSRRTDGGSAQKLMSGTGMPYGDQKNLLAQERSAPLAQADPAPQVKVPDAGSTAPPPSVFGDGSARPDEPITHGVNIGPGGGADILPLEQQSASYQPGPMTQMLAGLAARDSSGVLSSLYQSAAADGA